MGPQVRFWLVEVPMQLRLFAAALTVAFSLLSIAPALAAGGQFGNLNGTITDAATHAPISGAQIVAKSGSGTYSATTDYKGFFTILGMNVDSYTVTVSAKGHQTLNIPGVIVFGDETDSIGTVAMHQELQTIARVTSRSTSSAYQPSQTIDSYTVNQTQMLEATGKANTTNENAVLLSVPGVTLTNGGGAMMGGGQSNVPTIRGGAATEVGYQFDGVTYRDPFLSQNGGQGMINGVGEIQIVEGAGDATQGGVGSGVINIIPPRGSGPGTGEVDFESGGPNFNHQAAFSYGFSTPDGSISEYVSYTGQRYNPYFGYSFTPLNEYGNYFASAYETSDQFMNNFFYNFGKNKHETLQVLYTNTLGQGYQEFTQPYYYPYDPITGPALLGDLGIYSSTPKSGALTPAQFAAFTPLTYGVPSTDLAPNSPSQNFELNTRLLKIEYDNRLNPTTYFDLRYYNWDYLSTANPSTTLGAWGSNLPGMGQWNTTGGPTVGMSGDIEKQLGADLTVTLQGQYDILHPLFDGMAPTDSLISFDPGALGPGAISGAIPVTGSSGPVAISDWEPGGYFCNNGYFDCSSGLADTRLPTWGINYNKTEFQDWGAGLRFQFQPTDKLKFDLGVRDEGQNDLWYSQLNTIGLGGPQIGYSSTCAIPIAVANPGYTTAEMSAALASQCASSATKILSPYDVLNEAWGNDFLHPSEVQPRISVSYEVNRYNSLRFGYGRSAVFPNAQTGGTPFEFYGLAPYATIPAKTGSLCGWSATYVFPCQSVAQQMYWQGDNIEAPDAGFTGPAIYSNYDLSWNHLFASGWGLRVTPFAKLGTSLPADYYLNPVLGIFATENLGYNKTNGIELGLTTPQRSLGLSGFFTATYQNVLSTTPPLASGETTVPFVPTASLALGDLYRAGYVSPFNVVIGALENLRDGFTISPQLMYNIGYPYSEGNLIAVQLPNGEYVNAPNIDFGPAVNVGTASFIGSSPGSSITPNYADPADPGSANDPNIAATRGTPGTSANGGKLSHPNLMANLALQWKRGPNTFGIQFYNLFGNAFINTVPAVNTYYQPVANGLSGPQTNYNSCVSQVGNGNRGCYEIVPRELYAFSNGAYLLSNGDFTSGTPGFGPLQPFSFRVYYQRAI
jgi:hypothetical protein